MYQIALSSGAIEEFEQALKERASNGIITWLRWFTKSIRSRTTAHSGLEVVDRYYSYN